MRVRAAGELPDGCPLAVVDGPDDGGALAGGAAEPQAPSTIGKRRIPPRTPPFQLQHRSTSNRFAAWPALSVPTAAYVKGQLGLAEALLGASQDGDDPTIDSHVDRRRASAHLAARPGWRGGPGALGTPQGRAQNRRVEIVIVANDQMKQQAANGQ